MVESPAQTNFNPNVPLHLQHSKFIIKAKTTDHVLWMNRYNRRVSHWENYTIPLEKCLEREWIITEIKVENAANAEDFNRVKIQANINHHPYLCPAGGYHGSKNNGCLLVGDIEHDNSWTLHYLEPRLVTIRNT